MISPRSPTQGSNSVLAYLKGHRQQFFVLFVLLFICGAFVAIKDAKISLYDVESTESSTLPHLVANPSVIVGGDRFRTELQKLHANLSASRAAFRGRQRAELLDFVHQQEDYRKFAESEFLRAANALSVAAQQAQLKGYHDPFGVSTKLDGEDTWAFMIPVIKSNPRRQNRLVRNLCALSWPPKTLFGISFLVDNTSRPLVESTLPILRDCGIVKYTLYNDPPQKYVQPLGAIERHALESQVTRRAAIASARNYLLHKALRNRHTAVVWIDSDLKTFPHDSLLLLQRTGADIAVPRCVMFEDQTATYDLNSWKESPESRARVAKLPQNLPLFEGYDEEENPPRSRGYLRDAIVGECRWQQTGGCDPDGLRERENDLDCDDTVPAGASGFCHCADGTIQAKSNCKHEQFTCRTVCGAADGATDEMLSRYLPPRHGEKLGRWHMGDLRNTSAGLDFAVTLDAVGGTMIYARAEVFQKGVVFPTELVNHQIETEGFAQMALQYNFTVMGLPNLVIVHA